MTHNARYADIDEILLPDGKWYRVKTGSFVSVPSLFNADEDFSFLAHLDGTEGVLFERMQGPLSSIQAAKFCASESY